jgi:hypothetical protein
VFVQKKQAVPADQAIPPAVNGIKTDVIEVTPKLLASFTPGQIPPFDTVAQKTYDPHNRFDPLIGGISIGPCRAVPGGFGEGTLGAVLLDAVSEQPLLLSNFHVMAVDANGKQGDQMAQPGLLATVGQLVPANVVGSLERWAEQLDAAVASPSGRGVDFQILGIGQITGSNQAVSGMHGIPVRKSGATTGVTHGTMDGTEGNWTNPNRTNVLSITGPIGSKFSDFGDSGSVIVDNDNKIVGLLFAGGDGPNAYYGFAIAIGPVLTALGLYAPGDLRPPKKQEGKSPMTLVVGATGRLGTEICRRLTGKPFRAMVRSSSDPAKKETLKQLGGELVEADLKDRDSLDRACVGATAVITTATATLSQQEGDTFETVDLRGQMQLIDAASMAKVGHFVFVSISGNALQHGDNPLFEAKQVVENHLRRSGLGLHHSAPDIFHGILVQPNCRIRFCKCQGADLWLGRKRD